MGAPFLLLTFIMKNFILLSIFLLSGMSLFAQSGTIRGTVIEDESGEPVMFGDVTIEETGDYVSTDLEGAYSFDVAPGTYTLVFEYVGLADTKSATLL